MNVALYYFGGSGGFYALWHILLGTEYKCEFNDKIGVLENYEKIKGSAWPDILPEKLNDFPVDVIEEIKCMGEWNRYYSYYVAGSAATLSDIYKSHWNINAHNTWKETECWPKNSLTSKANYDKKIFYYCNPTLQDWECHKNDFRITLYTDWLTQVELSYYKNAYISLYGVTYENAIHSKNTINFQNEKIDCSLKNFLKADLTIKLQNVIKTSGQSLLEPLSYKIKQDNIDHNNFWLSLHTDNLKKLLTA